MTRSRYQLISQLTEMKQHFLENLYYKCNTLTKEIDTSVFGATMMERLTDSLSLDEIANMIQATKKQIKIIDKSIQTLIITLPDAKSLLSIPGIGPVYRQYYLKKYNEVPKNQHKSALLLTARKLVRLVDVLLRNHQLYAPERSA